MAPNSLLMKMMMVTMTEMRNLMMTMMMSVIMAVKKVLKMILIRRETAVLKTSLKTGAERAKEACTPR